MSAVPSSPRGTVVVGYILPPRQEVTLQRNQDEGSDEDDDEEEEDPEFLDMGEMESLSAGGRVFQSSVPPRLVVDFQILGSSQKLRVEGRFPLTDPWWQITCRVERSRNGHAILKRFLSYALRSDLKGEASRSIVALFLKACGVTSDHVTQFMAWLPKEIEVGLDTLSDLLEEFEEVEQHKAVAAHMKPLVSKSVAGECVHAATHYPLVLKHLPTLLPRKFKELLGMGKKRDRDALYETPAAGLSEDLLASLEEIIETEVWKLGFSYILYKELHLIRCEARLEAFAACGLFWSIPELQRHALQVYDQLNRQCQLSGSTYVERRDLEELLRPDLAEVSVWAAVHFLKEQGVVVFERQRVALQNLHTYETGIEKRLRRLIHGDGATEPWHIQLDVSKVLREAQEEWLRARAEAHAEAGKNTPGEESNGAGTPEQNGDMETETAQDETKDGPRSDPAFGHRETSTHSNGGSSWDDLNFDLRHSVGSQELSPTLEEPYRDDQPAQIELDPDQVRAGEMICYNPVTVISGKGGCGKTTVVSLVIKAAMQQRDREMEEVLKACEDFKNDPGDSQFLSQMDSQISEETTEEEGKKKKEEEEEEKLEVLLTAPTGRAAGLLTRRTGITAYTMHQVLVSYMNWRRVKEKDQDKEGERLRWKFRRVRALVVDEGSLVSVQILHSLLAILTNEARLQKFIMLGDVRQLPSIEPGNALYDLFHGLRKVQWSIEMRTNHRAESQLIVDNAGRIADMGQKRTFNNLDFDAIVDMNYSPEVPTADKRFIYVRVSDDDCALHDAISLLLCHGPGLQDHQTSQFIAFRRSDCALINELCCQHYVSHATKTHKKRMDFRVGDKICCTRNSYVTDRSQERRGTQVPPPPEQQVALAERTQPGGFPLPSDPLEGSSDGQTQQTERRKKEEEEKERIKERLCNGEIFYITEDVTLEEGGRRKRRYLTLDDGQGRELCVLYREVQKLCRIRHAWARTIHTFQGSEADTIAYVVGSGVAQDWRHVYTAVTRGQKRVYVISKDADLEKAIRGHIRKRNTRLGQLVRELVTEQRSREEDPMNQSCFTQPCLGTPSKPDPGSQASQTPGSYTICRHLKQEYVGPDLDTRDNCLEDDLNFSQAYNWCSPMEYPENHAALSSKACVTDTAEAAIAMEKDPFRELSGPPQSPLGVKRVSDFQNWNTPPKQPRVASTDTPTGASRLGLLTLNSPSPAPVVKHLFPREAATLSPVKFRPKVGLSQRFAAAAVSREEGRGGGEGPSSSHPREASPSRRVPGCDGPQGTSNSTVPIIYPDLSSGPSGDTDTKETCLQDDLDFTQEYSWPPMSGEDDDPLAVPHGSSVEVPVRDVPVSKETDFLQDLFSSC